MGCENVILCRQSMKNITISIDDDLYRLARIKAAEQSTSISAMFKAYIIRLTRGEESEFQRLEREEEALRQELKAGQLSLSPRHHMTRDELHGRDALH
jgi:Arc/MetJ family transcription regulator